MYCNFFGFSEKPFNVTPDPKFLYLTPGHREALASLMYGIHERRGFIALVGEVGTGKTTLLHTVLNRLDKEIRVGFIFNTDVSFKSMLVMALIDLGLAKSDERLSKAKALQRLNDFAIRQLSRGGNVVLLVDEAQNLDPVDMENLRLISNLETYKNKVIQVVLSGQPQLDAKLNRPELRQLHQRISLKRYITALTEKETYGYVQHRLSVAEYDGPALFDDQVQQLIWEYSGGVPRKINILCDNALLIGYGLRQATIDTSVIEEAIKDLSWSPLSGSSEAHATTPIEARAAIPIETTAAAPIEATVTTPIETDPQLPKKTRPRLAITASLVLAACTIFVVGLLLGSSLFNRQEGRPTLVSAKIRAKALSHDSSGPLTAGLEESANAPAGIENQKPSLSEASESSSRERQVVVAKEGDNLSEIIFQAYRRYTDALLSTILRENPEIQNPDRIKVGQAIRLPEKR